MKIYLDFDITISQSNLYFIRPNNIIFLICISLEQTWNYIELRLLKRNPNWKCILNIILERDYKIWSRQGFRHSRRKHTYIDFGDDMRVNCFSRNRISRHSNYLWFQFPIKGFYFTFNLISRFRNHVASSFSFLIFCTSLAFSYNKNKID